MKKLTLVNFSVNRVYFTRFVWLEPIADGRYRLPTSYMLQLYKAYTGLEPGDFVQLTHS